MKSTKSTQTTRTVAASPADAEFLGQRAGDPVAAAAARIVAALRLAESRILESVGVDVASLSLDRDVPFDSKVVVDIPFEHGATPDDHVRFRVAMAAATSLREAEESIVVELKRITQFVPHTRDGASYPRAVMVQPFTLPSSPPPAFAAAHIGAPGAPLERPPLQIAQSPPRRDVAAARALSSTPPTTPSVTQTNQAAPPPSAAAVDEVHARRMETLRALAEKFAQPPPISDWSAKLPRSSGLYAPVVQSSRAKSYAARLEAIVGPVGASSLGDDAEVYEVF